MPVTLKLRQEVIEILSQGLKLPKQSRFGERGRPETSIREKN